MQVAVGEARGKLWCYDINFGWAALADDSAQRESIDAVVTPIVALVEPDFSLTLDDFEVAEAFEVPLHFLMTPANHRRHEIEFAGQRRQFLSMPWQATGADGQPREYFIWGATAAMLRNLYRFLSL